MSDLFGRLSGTTRHNHTTQAEGAIANAQSHKAECGHAFELLCASAVGALPFKSGGDLKAIAGLLAADQHFDIQFRFEPGVNALLRLFLTCSSAAIAQIERPSRSNAEQPLALLHALKLAFPDLDVIPATDDASHDGVRLIAPGRRFMLDHRAVRGRVPPRAKPPKSVHPIPLADRRAQIALTPLGWAGPDVARLLSGLMALAQPFDLRLRLQRFDLDLKDRLALGQAARQVCPDMTMIMEDPYAAKYQFAARAILEDWLDATGGFKVSYHLALPDAGLDKDMLLQTAASQLFGPVETSLPDDDIESDLLDLSSCFPTHGPCPDLIPAPVLLQSLGVAGGTSLPRRNGRAIHDTSAMTLGLDAAKRPVAVPRADLQRHMLLLGSTGVGKSTLLKQMIRQDMAQGLPIFLIDPHGDLAADVANMMPTEGPSTPWVFDLKDGTLRFGLDLLRQVGPDRARSANLAANEMVAVFRKVLYHDSPEGFGPMFESYFRNAILLLQLSDGPTVSLTDLDRVFSDVVFRRTLLQTCRDEMVHRFWTGIALKAGGEASLENIAPYIVSKLTQFSGSPLIRPIIGGSLPHLDLGAALDEDRPILINLAKGSIGASDALLIGALITAELMRVLMARCARPRGDRRPARIYLDEFQTYATDTLAQLMAEGRKTGAEMVLASQDLTSFGGSRFQPDVANAILSNVGNLITFRTGPKDAHLLADWFAPAITPQTLTRLPDRTFAARILHNGVPIEPEIVRAIEG